MTTYQNEYRNNDGVTREDIEQYTPAILEETRGDGLTDQYLQVPTIKVLDTLATQHFYPVQIMQSKVRTRSARHTTHLARLRQEQYLERNLTSDLEDIPEIIIIGSSNGDTVLRALGGVFRMVCSNGQISGDVAMQIKVVHRTYHYLDEVLEAVAKIAELAPAMLAEVAAMKQIALTPAEQLELARKAAILRFGEQAVPHPGAQVIDGTVTYLPEHLLEVKREADKGDDLWRVMNRIQEHALTGKVPGISHQGEKTRKRPSQPMRSIYNSTNFNQQLWQFAMALKDEKIGIPASAPVIIEADSTPVLALPERTLEAVPA